MLDPGEACDNGAANADAPAFVLQQNKVYTPITPVKGTVDAATFYSYGKPNGASGDTGFEAADTAHFFLYQDTTTGQVSLIAEVGIEGAAQGPGTLTMIISVTGSTCTVTLSDDNAELKGDASGTSFSANWKFSKNTDGGVMACGLGPGTSAAFDIAPVAFTGVTTFSWINGDGTSVPLDGSLFQLFTYGSALSTCRADCSVPTCGDGILDAGEACDDGNAVDDATCPATCTY